MWVELRIVSMDTSLLCHGLVITWLSHRGDGSREKCIVSKLEGLDPTTLCEYREDCGLNCYACKLLPKSTTCAAGMCRSIRPATCNVGQNCRPVESIAYVLTTSGTTGCPKVVHVPHCSIVPNIVDLRSRFNILPDDVIFNAAPLTFDPSFVEVSGLCFKSECP